eukprot:10899562-Heterocapsa_arctica.AAC.1
MEVRPPRTLRVKWVPAHMKEEHVPAGILSEEHTVGNEEADKLATTGNELHKVSTAMVEEVKKQDEL